MRETKLGRWVGRVACAVGVGAAVLGVPAAASAADVSQAGVVLYQVPGQITHVGLADAAKTATVNTTNDMVWT